MEERSSFGESPLTQWFMRLGIAGIVLLFLIYGRSFLLPVVVAVLTFTVLSAALAKLSRIRLGTLRPPRWLAVTLGVLILGLIVFIIYSIVSAEILLLINDWPKLIERFQGVLASLSAWIGQDLSQAIRTNYGDFDVVAGLRGILHPAGFAIAAIVIVALYVAFMFVESSYLPAKIDLMFANPARAREVKEVAGRIIASVHRFLFLKTLLSLGNTLAAYAIMKVIGLEFAEMWALLTFFLNFIPKIGSITATVVPSLLAVLQFQEWQPVLLLAIGLTLAHGITGEVVEPMVMGRTLNLSSLVIMLALTFWSMVWGIVGTFLAIPLMVVIVTICAKVPSLRPVAVLLSSDGILDFDGQTPAPPAKGARSTKSARGR